ncbi:hypothetical protein [Candidatus Nitrospira neomarina]|uniref:asparagine synthase (glutamine-hydrolyzing) n=1 Tax=Candidatus Nitrospira neomarina TaxID=3020899 RepID=A0AA96GL58_9BACT|nr:hypothetical protein [Candidatus Nitrospira neomarina]WNM63981.1 hypothetical protein PQG83_09545 [Candidatus Nitrospira neomarina]
MGAFLAFLYPEELRNEASQTYEKGRQAASRLLALKPQGAAQSKEAFAVSFARTDGSGGAVVGDPKTGSWLLAIGTWIHRQSFECQTEQCLLTQYLEIGSLKLAGALEGFFTILIGDGRTGEVTLITDITGSCHCFAREFSCGIALSSSSLVLGRLGMVELDPLGCQEFLSVGTIFEERTLFKNVHKLPGATIFTFSAGRVQREQHYWDIKHLTPEAFEGRYSTDSLWEALTRSARFLGGRYPTPICDLTGGYDSRALVAAFLGAGVPVTCTVSGQPQNPDVIVSKGLARVAGLDHIHLPRTPQVSLEAIMRAFQMTDGECNLFEYAGILQTQERLIGKFDLSVNGSFGGLARGLWWELLFPYLGASGKLDGNLLVKRRYAFGAYDRTIFPHEIQVDIVDHLSGVIDRLTEGLAHFPNTFQMDFVNLSMRIHRWQGRIASSTNRLRPCLSPFGLRSVLEVVLQTKTQFRVRSLLIRHMLHRYDPTFARYPLALGHPAEPLTWNNMHRFFPLVVHFGKKGIHKLSQMANLNVFGSQFICNPDSRLNTLLKEDAVRDLLNPSSMRTLQILEKAPLKRFLSASQDSDFLWNEQLMRIFSIEYTLRSLEAEQNADS